jgi:predicted patatin/cPLA2 family phospholipase
MGAFTIVCDPGEMRGAWVAGLMWGWRQWLVQANYAVGASSGAHNLVSLLAGHHSQDFWSNVLTSPQIFDGRRQFRGGYAANPHLLTEQHLKRVDLQAFYQSRTQLVIPLFNVGSGQTEFHPANRQNLRTLLVGTAAVPLLAPPLRWQESVYVDGGTAEPSPLKFAVRQIASSKVIVFGTLPDDYCLKRPGLLSSWLAFNQPWARQARAAVRQRDRAFAEAISLARQPPPGVKVWRVAPHEPLPMKYFTRDPKLVAEIWRLGYQVSQDRQEELLTFLED